MSTINLDKLGYKTAVKSAAVKSIKDLFPDSYVGAAGMSDVNVSIEYPITQAEYPAIMVEFLEDEIYSASIGNPDYELSDDDVVTEYITWRFSGSLKVSFFALKAYQRDLISDGFIKAVGFSDAFKRALWTNPYIGIVAKTKTIRGAGESTTPGTPWGSGDLTYFSAYAIDVVGEFFTESTTAGIMKRIEVIPLLEDEPLPSDDDDFTWSQQ